MVIEYMEITLNIKGKKYSLEKAELIIDDQGLVKTIVSCHVNGKEIQAESIDLNSALEFLKWEIYDELKRLENGI